MRYLIYIAWMLAIAAITLAILIGNKKALDAESSLEKSISNCKGEKHDDSKSPYDYFYVVVDTNGNTTTGYGFRS